MYSYWAANLGLAVQWESQQLALCSELMMGGWDSWREEILYTMSCSQRLQPVGSEGWRVHWATENVDRPHNHSSHKSRCTPRWGREQAGQAVKKGKPKPEKWLQSLQLHPIFPLLNKHDRLIWVLRKPKWLNSCLCTGYLRVTTAGSLFYGPPACVPEETSLEGEARVTCSVPLASLPRPLDRHLLCDLFSFLGLSKAPPFVLKQEREHWQ